MTSKTATATVDPRYFSEAITWEQDVIRSVKRSRSIAWFIAIVTTTITLMSLGCLAMLLPLKSFEPYVIEVDKTNGYLEVKRPLAAGDLDQSEAVTAMNVVRYLRARETYDPPAIKDNFDLAQLLSTGVAAHDLVELYSPNNPQNPVRLFGREGRTAVTIKSVQFPNLHTALVRFSTLQRAATALVTQHWAALIRLHYTRAPMRNEWRFDNPLGFQVTEYRRDQESAPTTTELAPGGDAQGRSAAVSQAGETGLPGSWGARQAELGAGAGAAMPAAPAAAPDLAPAVDPVEDATSSIKPAP